MAMARTGALECLGPCERREGKNVNVVESHVAQTSAAIYVACGGISTR